MILHINTAKVVGPHELYIEFSTGEKKLVNVRPLLKGPIFKPLRDPKYFGLVRVDPVFKTVAWPNGADLAPEALYELDSAISEPIARKVEVTEKELKVALKDGRTIAVPLNWYPRLAGGTQNERQNWELLSDGEGIHWPDLDEDISVQYLVEGRRSGESKSSLKHWKEWH